MDLLSNSPMYLILEDQSRKFVGGLRAVIKISRCRANDAGRRGIQQLGILFGSIFLLFSYKSRRGHAHNSQGKSPAPGPRPLITALWISGRKGSNFVDFLATRSTML